MHMDNRSKTCSLVIFSLRHDSTLERYPDTECSYFSMKTYIPGTHKKHLAKSLLLHLTKELLLNIRNRKHLWVLIISALLSIHNKSFCRKIEINASSVWLQKKLGAMSIIHDNIFCRYCLEMSCLSYSVEYSQ